MQRSPRTVGCKRPDPDRSARPSTLLDHVQGQARHGGAPSVTGVDGAGRVAIVGGCGHVGLPLGLAFASCGLRVALYDLNADAVASVNAGRMPFDEPGAADVLTEVVGSGRLEATDAACRHRRRRERRDRDRHADRRAPQPGSQRGAGDHRRHRLRAARWPAARAPQHRVSRASPRWSSRSWSPTSASTSTSRSVPSASPRARRWWSSSSCHRSSRPRSPRALERATKLFRNLAHDIVYLEPEEAELAKLFTNTWRYIKFATANQLYMMANDFGLDYERIRSAPVLQLSPRRRPAQCRVRRRAVPVQGHDAARRVQQQQLPPRPGQRVDQRGAPALRRRPARAALRSLDHDGRRSSGCRSRPSPTTSARA